MKSKIYFVTQAKGGSGKSILTFMLAEKYPQAMILDLDDATTTTLKQLAYRKPGRVSFLDPVTKQIDRSAFNNLFESVLETGLDLFIADLGGSVAEQLPKYFSVDGVEDIRAMLEVAEIQLKIVCVVGGGNIFKSTMEYLDELVEAVSGAFEIVVALNEYFPLAQEQHETLVQYVQAKKVSLVTFNLAKSKGALALRAIEHVLNSGRGTSELSPFVGIYFRKPIADLNL